MFCYINRIEYSLFSFSFLCFVVYFTSALCYVYLFYYIYGYTTPEIAGDRSERAEGKGDRRVHKDEDQIHPENRKVGVKPQDYKSFVVPTK